MVSKNRCKGTTKYPLTQEKVVDIFHRKSLIINISNGQLHFLWIFLGNFQDKIHQKFAQFSRRSR